MKSNNLIKKIFAIILSVVIITGLMPYQSFADTPDTASEIQITQKEKNNDEANIDEANHSVNATTESAITLKKTNSERTFDIQEIEYWRSSHNFGLRYESKWEGVAPYGPLFGHMVNHGKDTRPLGKEYGDYGWGWGSSDWMTGYLMVDLESFGETGTNGLSKDEYGLATIGIVRVDDKYSRTDEFSTWNDSIADAFKEYNGNLGFGEKGWGNDGAYQETKLVVWDGYRRIPGFSWISAREYVKSTEDIASDSTSFRKEFCEYVQKHLEKGAKLEGFLTVTNGLKYVYEPTYVKYRSGKNQIINIPQIKITGLTYDVELEHKNAPDGVELPSVIKVQAETELKIPGVDGYEAEITYQDGRVYESKKVEENLKLIVTWTKDEPFEDIGENYYKEAKPEDIIIDEETGMPYVKK